ncbi:MULTISPECIES: acylphosphatase [Psychrilyobacter]|uniref:acylphosphatase n=1 Tax=Psychrilyobacter piezotolerans TaxID=2293438 RepID=A0ABX9KHS1_9FUSO|nr:MULTISPECIES: acylphosphatase [Psychrilyobacter]MCS5421447.1 acylphosphatase [Psychrilyobacter sp. S5]NDI77801.1 acylphosphatase [Psychrilyobacter piezotolerans]RDE62346.1 acylphosphatase [Psychrilyobacter sp. S5]REI41444.1 acylphosphatase [Psychrilyobacter piezotolerans]
MTKKYIVYGRVQGVGFRYFVQELAKKLKFNGRVKNLFDGSVEVVIDSSRHEEILKEIKKGNFFSHVDEIKEIETLETTYEDFKVLY